MPTIIDHSEHVAILTVTPGEDLIIEKDDGSPKHAEHTRVTATDISLGLGSTVTLQNQGILHLTGPVAANLLGTIDIGDGGKLSLSGPITGDTLSHVDFTGHDSTSILAIATSDHDLPGSIVGFGVNDQINLDNLVANSVDFMPNLTGTGGELVLYDGNQEVGKIGLTGDYTNANFALSAINSQNGVAGTTINYLSAGLDHHFAGMSGYDHGAWASLAQHA